MKKLLICSSLASLFSIGYCYAQPSYNLAPAIPMHTMEEQKILNENYCKKLGSVDITDYSSATPGVKAYFGISCKVTDYRKFLETIPYATAGNLDADGMPELSNIPNNDIVGELSVFSPVSASVFVWVPGGTVSKDYPWYAQAIANYYDAYGDAVVLASAPQVKGCTSQPGRAQLNGGDTSGIFSVVQCPAFGRVGSTPVNGTACLNGACVNAVPGTIIFN